MATSFGALCTDFYITQKLAVKMDLPSERETLLDLFNRVKKSDPALAKLRRYDGELLLESARGEGESKWLSLQRTTVRTSHANPRSMDEGRKLHKLVLELAPPYLSISPIEVDHLELVFGFDLECKGNQDEIVYDALFRDTPLGGLLEPLGDRDGSPMDVQPIFAMALGDDGDQQLTIEIKTRSRNKRGDDSRYRDEPIGLFVIAREYGPVDHLNDLGKMHDRLSALCEQMASERLVPDVLMPISRQIISSSA